MRFQGPGGIDKTLYSNYLDPATASITLSSGTIGATIGRAGNGYYHTGGFPYVPGYTWSGGTVTGGGAPANYPAVTLVVGSGANWGRILSISLSGYLTGWETAPTLTIDDPEQRVYQTTICYPDPPAGDWTVTLSHPCYTATRTATTTVVQCHSQTLVPLILPLPFTSISISDDKGSVDPALTGLFLQDGCVPLTGFGGIVFTAIALGGCRAAGKYSYASTDMADNIACPYYTTQLVAHQSNDVQVGYSVVYHAFDDGWHFTVTRTVPGVCAETACGSNVYVFNKTNSNNCILTDCFAGMRADGTAVAPCGEAINLTIDFGPCTTAFGSIGVYEIPLSGHCVGTDPLVPDCTEQPTQCTLTAS